MKIKFLGGRGEPLLMIHGWGVNSEIWVSLVDELKLFASVYLIDLPGMGGSSSISPYTLDNIAKEIKANVPIKKCNILGWSLGGQVAMSMAIRMPEIIEKLILMSTTPCFVEKKDWPHGVNKQFFLNFEMEAKQNLNNTLMKFFLIQTKDIDDSKNVMRFLKNTFIEIRDDNKCGMQSALNVLKNTDLRNEIKKIDKPTLIITGDKDRLTSSKASIWLYEKIEGATLKEIKGANHMPFISHRETMTESVKKFLQMINKKIKRIAFNRAAMTYDDYSVLQKQISLDLFDRLSLIKIAPNFILDLGSGTGENNSGFKNIFKNKNIINYDFSERMLMRAKSKEKDFLGLNKLLGKNNISYICGDMEHLPIKKNLIDLVWTSSSLQWCNDLNKTFLGIKEILNYGGLFIFSTFGPKTLTELSAINKKLSQNDTVNSFTDMHQIGDMLVANGFSDPVLDSDEYTLTYSNVEKLFVDIKSIGATSSNPQQKKGLRGKNYFKRMAAEYDKYKKSGLLPATYEVIYGHAWNMNKNQNFKTFEIKHE